jgi:pimeloyl-ACP methyl ester carboxylesterase
MVRHHTIEVDGLNIFYREAGDPANPKLVLLGGFPASSHQFRNLIPALADRFHVLSPDYPGFGNSDMPDPATFAYTFDRISETIEGWLTRLGLARFGLYVQDYGGPVGFRIVGRHPEWLEWLIVQNSNAYEEGFSAAWDGIRHRLWKSRSPETEAPLGAFLQLEGIRSVYLHGHLDPALISPDNWNMDFRFMERPGARRVQLDLLYDYRTNVSLYPVWQKLLRDLQPETLIFWGQSDVFFTPEGGEAYLRDLPEAELHRLESGHFAVEDSLEAIASDIRRFYEEKVAGQRSRVTSRETRVAFR